MAQAQGEKQPIADTVTAANTAGILAQITGMIPPSKWTPAIMGVQALIQMFMPRFRAWRAKSKAQR